MVTETTRPGSTCFSGASVGGPEAGYGQCQYAVFEAVGVFAGVQDGTAYEVVGSSVAEPVEVPGVVLVHYGRRLDFDGH